MAWDNDSFSGMGFGAANDAQARENEANRGISTERDSDGGFQMYASNRQDAETVTGAQTTPGQRFGDAFRNFVGFNQRVNVDPRGMRQRAEITGFDPTRSGLIGLGLSALNPALGGLYGAQMGMRSGNPIGGMLSGVAGLAGAAAPFSQGAAMLGGLSGLNNLSGAIGGPSLDSLARAGGPRPVGPQGPQQPGMGGESEQQRMARLLMAQQATI